MQDQNFAQDEAEAMGSARGLSVAMILSGVMIALCAVSAYAAWAVS